MSGYSIVGEALELGLDPVGPRIQVEEPEAPLSSVTCTWGAPTPVRVTVTPGSGCPCSSMTVP